MTLEKLTPEQREVIELLKSDPQKMKQLGVMLGVIDKAFADNMGSFIKLVQMDAMKEFNSRCDKDGVGGDRVNFSHGVIDVFMGLVDRDLKLDIKDRYESAWHDLEESIGRE